MNAIRIKNLRVLEDTQLVELKPLTLLLGENGSGKSTFLRVFPLLRQSVEARTKGPILWYGRLVDFGNFSTAVRSSHDNNNNSIIFQFRYLLLKREILRFIGSPHRINDDYRNKDTIEVQLTLQLTSESHATHIEQCLLQFEGHKVVIDFDHLGKIRNFCINDRDLSKGAKDLHLVESPGFVPTLRYIPKSTKEDRAKASTLRRLYMPSTPFTVSLVEKVAEMAHRNTKEDRVHNLVSDFGIGTAEQLLEEMRNSQYATETWKKHVSEWNTDNEDFKLIRDLAVAQLTMNLLDASDQYLFNCVRNITYIAPLRATAERYYRFQDLAVDEVDFQGQNLAMFLLNLQDREKEAYRAWMERHLGFIPHTKHTKREASHISIEVEEVGSGRVFNLADMGFGFSQLLPVVTQLWWQSRRHQRRRSMQILPYKDVPIILAIEQPELHLHPRFQALLAKAFVAAVKEARENRISLRLIIETHSDTIINHLGHQIASQRADPSDINIVIFEKEPESHSSTIRLGGYDSEGFLKNWPYGFFEPEEE